MKRIVTIQPTLSKLLHRRLKITDINELNGYYNYANQTAIINVGSLGFAQCSEDGIIDLFTSVDTHETLHHEIFKITGKYANDTEEKIIENMCS